MSAVSGVSQFAVDQLAGESRDAARADTVAAFRAERAELLVGTFDVGADEYSGEFWQLDARNVLPTELALVADWRDYSIDRRELHRLPNGDWLEVLGGKSWTRHTYDLAYALDRARRATIGGYVFSADLAGVIEQIVEARANYAGIYAEWQQFRAAKPHIHAYGGVRNLHAAEQQARWTHCITVDMLPRHPQHAALLLRAVELLGAPDALREFPAPLDIGLNATIREIEALLQPEEP